MTFAQSSQQAKELLCTLHHCTHFCFPYEKKKKVWADKVGSFRVREKIPNKTTNQSTKPNQPQAVRACLPVLKSAASLNGGWGGKEEARLPPWVFLNTFGSLNARREFLKLIYIFFFLNEALRSARMVCEGERWPTPLCPSPIPAVRDKAGPAGTPGTAGTRGTRPSTRKEILSWFIQKKYPKRK